MISLFMDASLNHCNLALVQDGEVTKSITIKTNNNLTDLIVEHIDSLLSNVHLKHHSIQRLLISIGPGSFTGIRVVSVIAKTWNFVHRAPIYIMDSLRLQLPNNDGISLIDAKGKNWYITIYQNNKLMMKPQMVKEDKLAVITKKYPKLKVYNNYQVVDIFKNIITHEGDFKLVRNVRKLTPLYIKKAL